MVDSYTSSVLKNEYNALVTYINHRVNTKSTLPVRLPIIPEDVSENIVKFVIRNYLKDTTCKWSKTINKSGDLFSEKEGQIEVKCYTSDGPISFGPKESWDSLYLLDATKFTSGLFTVWRLPYKNTSTEIKSLKVNKTQTFEEQSTEKRRPRLNPKSFHQCLGQHAQKVFEGSFESIFESYANEEPEIECIKKDPTYYSDMKVSELKELCKKKGLKVTGKKADLVKRLQNNDILTVIHHPQINSDGKLRMIDLFAGTGAFTHAFQSTGKVQCVYSNDMNPHSKDIYDLNFDHKMDLKDLNDVDVDSIPEHDILTAGFPCQPFSIAGKQLGFEDKRSNVFWKILEIIERHNPKCVILENVKNLVSHDEGKTFETITSNLEEKGYNIHYKVLNTSSITGIPQHRERIYMVCLKDKSVFDSFNLEFEDIPKKHITEMLESDIQTKYYYTESSSTWSLLKDAVKSKDTVYQYRRVYVRENKNNECPTLTANMGEGGHNVPIVMDDKGIRKLTPRECFNFQGFPKEYKLPKMADSHLYKLAGNAVSHPVVRMIANKLIHLL